MNLGERIIVPERDETIPGKEVGEASDWLNSQNAYEFLPKVAANGDTALFWYVAALLAQYKHFVEESNGHPEDRTGQQDSSGDRTSTVWQRLARLIHPRR